MIREPIRTEWKLGFGVIAVVTLVAGYLALSYCQHRRNRDDTTIPGTRELVKGVQTATTVNERSGERWLLVDAEATAKRLFLGLACGYIGAMLVGLSMGCFKSVEALLLPPLALLAKVPPTAALAVFFVMVGTNTVMYTAMLAFGIVPVMGQAIYLAVRDVPDEFLYKGYTLGASNSETVCSVIVPSVLPKLIDAARLAIGPAVVYLIAAEMVCSDVGFGYRIRLQARLLNMNVVYPYLALLAAFGFTMDYGLRYLQRKVSPWYIPEGEQEQKPGVLAHLRRLLRSFRAKEQPIEEGAEQLGE